MPAFASGSKRVDLLIPKRAAAPLGPGQPTGSARESCEVVSLRVSMVIGQGFTSTALLSSREGLQDVARSEDYAPLDEILSSRMLPATGTR